MAHDRFGAAHAAGCIPTLTLVSCVLPAMHPFPCNCCNPPVLTDSFLLLLLLLVQVRVEQQMRTLEGREAELRTVEVRLPPGRRGCCLWLLAMGAYIQGRFHCLHLSSTLLPHVLVDACAQSCISCPCPTHCCRLGIRLCTSVSCWHVFGWPCVQSCISALAAPTAAD